VNAADITMLDSESIRFTPDQLALTNIALNRAPAGGIASLGRANLRTMHRILSLSLLVLTFAASAFAAAPDGRPQPLTKALFPTYAKGFTGTGPVAASFWQAASTLSATSPAWAGLS
jgi:hypothetical protein